MDIYEHKSQGGLVLFHLIHKTYRESYGVERKKLVSSVPAEVLRLSSEKVYNLFRLESKRIETESKIDFFEDLASSVALNPISRKFFYPDTILGADGTVSANKLNEVVKGLEDLNLLPGNHMSESDCQIKHFIFCVKFYRYRDFFKADFIRDVKIITRLSFERGMSSMEQWEQYNRFKGQKGMCYLTTKTVKGFDCNILFLGKPVFEYICHVD